jgi:type I site-specific restriction-modification system R (restriction) subunit
MTEKDKLIQDLKRKLEEYENRKKDTLDFIEETCQYDKRLLGYERGIERSETSTLVLKLTGKYPRELKRD